MTTYHVKTSKMSSFKPVTRKQPFVCRAADPKTQAHIIVHTEDERFTESVEEVRERLNRLVPGAALCEGCAAGLEGKES